MPSKNNVRNIKTYFDSVAKAKASHDELKTNIPFAVMFNMDVDMLNDLIKSVKKVITVKKKQIVVDETYTDDEKLRIANYMNIYTAVPVVEPIVEPVIELKQEPIAEPVIELKQEPIVEPVIEEKEKECMTIDFYNRQVQYYEKNYPQGLEKFKAGVKIVESMQKLAMNPAHQKAMDQNSMNKKEKKQLVRKKALRKSKEIKAPGEQWKELVAESKCRTYDSAKQAYSTNSFKNTVENPCNDPELKPTDDERELYNNIQKKNIKANEARLKRNQRIKLESFKKYKDETANDEPLELLY